MATSEDKSPESAKAPVLMDVGELANLLTQARGPILDRLTRQLPKFAGDGTVDVQEWLGDLERLCKLERVDPVDIVSYLLEGTAARLYRRMLVGDASQWSVVRDALVAEYATPRQEAWRRFVDCQLGAGEAVDVYLDRLERIGGRLGLTSEDLVFRTKFYEGLPASVYEWAVTHEGAYRGEFSEVLTRVRDRLATRRAVAGRSRRPDTVASTVAAASGKQGGSDGGCYRCGGAHRVKVCPSKQQGAAGKGTGSSSKRSSSGKRAGCFRCGSLEHRVRDCPQQAPSGTAAGSTEGGSRSTESGSGFLEEGASRGDASSAMMETK